MLPVLKRYAALLLGLTLLLTAVPPAWSEMPPERQVVAPSCTEPGYEVITDPATGTITIINLPAPGHAWSDWLPAADGLTQHRSCPVCGKQEEIRCSTIPEDAIARLNLRGSLDGIGKKQKVTLQAEFISREHQFTCQGVMTLQGHSTFGLTKRNYTIRFYDDPEADDEHKIQFGQWKKEHKFILKANYADLTQCRNLVGASIWHSMTASREKLPNRIAALPTLGAVDGFPVAVYLNETFIGLYTMNLHKDDDLYQMKTNEKAALMICNRETSDEALFRAPAAFAEDYSSDWELEYCGTKDETWAQNSFNALIDFVMNASEQDFRKKLPRYLDVDAAIDYLILIYTLGLQHSGAKDLVMLNYGKAWIPTAYDMDEAFGLDGTTMTYLSPEDFVPVCTDGGWDSGTGSLLWDRLLNTYEDQIRARYTALRRTVLSEESILQTVRDFIGGIPEAYYDLDANLYPDRPGTAREMAQQIETYVTQRLKVLDAIWEENK